MSRIIDQRPRDITEQPGSGKKRSTGLLLRTTRQFDDFLEDLGAEDPRLEGIVPTIQPVAVVDGLNQEEHHLFNSGIIENIAGTQDSNLFGTTSSQLESTSFAFLRLNWILHMFRHSGAGSETRAIEIFANFPTSNPATPAGSEAVNLLKSSESLASGEHRRLIVPMKVTGGEDWETIQLSGASSGPVSVITHQGASLHRIPASVLHRLRIRIGNADNATADQRVIVSFTVFG